MGSENDHHLEDCITKFGTVFYKQDEYTANEMEMWTLMENYTKELELSRENENCMRKNLEKCLENEYGNITTKYVHLREKCRLFEEEVAILRSSIEDLQMQVVADVETVKNDCLQKFSEIEDSYKRDYSALKEKLEDEKKAHEAKEKSLREELQLAQATTDLRCDEIESKFMRQLVDTTSKLRASQNMTRNLQSEIYRLKIQLTLAQQAHAKLLKAERPDPKFQPLPITNSKVAVNYDESEHSNSETQSENATKIYTIPNRDEAPPSVLSHGDYTPSKSKVRFQPLPIRSKRVSVNYETPESGEFEVPQNMYQTPNRNNTSLISSHGNFTREKYTPKMFKYNTVNLPRRETPAPKKEKKRKLYDPQSFDESSVPQFSQQSST